MRILIDTNILVSAALNRNGTPFKAYFKAVIHPNNGIVTDQNIDELKRIFNRKFPQKLNLLERFLAIALPEIKIVETPIIDIPEEKFIRDVNDRPILRAAIENKVDILLTGDKDFLESGIEQPKAMTAAEFLEYNP